MMFGSTAVTIDPATALYNDLGIDVVHMPATVRSLEQHNSRYLKDLKLNISNALQAESLVGKDAFLVAYAIAVNEKHAILSEAFATKAKAHGATDAAIAEVMACTSLMNANNVYYRFRHFMHDEFYDMLQAGIRMSIMANPVIGKELFELVSLAVSAVNGCELCVTSHEKAVQGHGSNKQRIHDAVRLAAVVKSLTLVL